METSNILITCFCEYSGYFLNTALVMLRGKIEKKTLWHNSIKVQAYVFLYTDIIIISNN